MVQNLRIHAHQALERLLDEVVARQESNGVRELEDAIRICLRWPDDLQETIESVWRLSVAGQVDDFEGVGKQILSLYDLDLAIVEKLTERVRNTEAQGTMLRKAAELAPLRDRLAEQRRQFDDTWPWINEAIIKEALAEYARGESQTTREILDELQGKAQ